MPSRSNVLFVLGATAGVVAVYLIDRSAQADLNQRLTLTPDPDSVDRDWDEWIKRAQARNRLVERHNTDLARNARKRNKQPRILKDHEFDAFGL